MVGLVNGLAQVVEEGMKYGGYPILPVARCRKAGPAARGCPQ